VQDEPGHDDRVDHLSVREHVNEVASVAPQAGCDAGFSLRQRKSFQ